jgi:acyl transferase domain-containing protein
MEKIAIIGLSGLFPGSETSEQYWHNLIQEKDLTS